MGGLGNQKKAMEAQSRAVGSFLYSPATCAFAFAHFLCYIMTASDSVNDWSCDDNAADAQISDYSISDSDESQNATFPQQGELRPAGSLPTFVPFARWNPERSYRGGHTLRYNVEWKLFVKNRERAGQSELDIVLSPKDLWKNVLQPKVIEEISGKPWKEGAALFILSVNDRKTKSIKKRYATQAKIEWPFVTKTLQEWGKSFDDEKTLTVEVKLYYEVSTNLTGKGTVKFETGVAGFTS